MAVADVVRQISIDLNDHEAGHEFVTWSESQLEAYVLEGLQLAFSFRPDLFVAQHVVKLEPGHSDQKFCDCTQIRRVLGVCTAEGRVLYSLRKLKQSDKNVWTGFSCPSDPRDYKATEYSIDADTDTVFIEPPPPAGQDVYLLVECASLPSDPSEIGNAAEVRAAVIQWALYRAKSIDSENNAAIFQVARDHRNTFFQLLRIQAVAKASIEAEGSSDVVANALQRAAGTTTNLPTAGATYGTV